jgi:hypothetical protein
VIRKLSSKPPAVQATHQQEWPDQPAESDLLPAEKGMNRSAWDLRYDAPINIPGSMWDGGDGPKGPRAVPGKYQVKLMTGGATETVPLELVADPRVKASQADLERQLALALKISASISQADETVNQIRDVRAQLAALKKRLGSDEKAKAIAAAADAIDKKMTPVEDALNNSNVKASEDTLNFPVRLNDQLSSLESFVESADMPPTAQAIAAYEDLSAKVEAEAAQWKEIAEKDLAALNESMRKENIPAVAPAPAKKE